MKQPHISQRLHSKYSLLRGACLAVALFGAATLSFAQGGVTRTHGGDTRYPHTSSLPESYLEMRRRAAAIRDDGRPHDALRLIDAYARTHGDLGFEPGSVYARERSLCYVMLGDFAQAKRVMEPWIRQEKWEKCGFPEGVDVYVLATLGLPYTDLPREYWYGPRWWDTCGRKDYSEAAWPEPTTPELVRFYAGLFVVDANDRGVNDAIARQLEGIWRDHPMLVMRRSRRYEERKMWQHAINEAHDLYRWTETPDQRRNVDSRISWLTRMRDHGGD